MLETFFSTYSLLIFIRIALSWFPSLYRYQASKYILFLTDPYMNIFKKLIPPVGGVLDISPMIALVTLRLVKTFITTLFL